MSVLKDYPHANADPLDAEVDPAIVAAEVMRARTFRRWFIGIILCVVGAVGTRLVWGFVADWRLSAQVERYRAAGEPILFEDFSSPLVAKEDNAAPCYRQAESLLVYNTQSKIDFGSFLSHHRDVATSFPEDTDIILAENREALSWIRQARGMSTVDWGIGLSSTSRYPSSLHRMLSSLTNLASISARRQHALHNDSDAIESLLDILALAKFESQPGIGDYWLQYRISDAHENLRNILQRIIPTLQVEGNDAGTATMNQPAQRAQVDKLIRELLDESHPRSHWIDNANAERARSCNAAMEIFDDTPSPGAGLGHMAEHAYWKIMLHPLWKKNTLWMLQHETSCRDAGCASTWSMARKTLIDAPTLTCAERESVFRHTPRLVSEHLLPWLEPSMKPRFQVLAIRRMAATALAIRLYEIDHGRLPQDLSVLVPEYLDALPDDPFGDVGQPFVYRVDGSTIFLYSVHENGIDDGGRYTYSFRHITENSADYPFYLTRNHPQSKWRLVPQANGSKFEIE